LPGASSSTAGITVTGIAGGNVRVAVVEIGGLSSVVRVGDRIRDFTVMAISGNEVVFGQGDRTFRLPLAQARTSPTTTGEAPPAVAIPAEATPAAPAPPVAEQPTQTSTLLAPPAPIVSAYPQPQTVLLSALTLGPTAYPQQTLVPLLVVPLPPESPTPPVTPYDATTYTPSGTSIYVTFYAPSSTSAYPFTIASTTPQNTITVRGITVLPVADTQVQTFQPPAPILPSSQAFYREYTTLYRQYTPTDTAVYGLTSGPTTSQTPVTLRGVTAVPVAANQAQSTAEVLLWPTYQVELAPTPDKQSAKEVAGPQIQTGFGAKLGTTSNGQYIVTLLPPAESTISRGLYVIKSVGGDVPIKIQLVP